MAVKGDFFTIKGVSEVAKRGAESFNLMMGVQELDLDNLVQQTIDILVKRIRDLQKLETDFKTTFKCGSLGEFEQRVEMYYYKEHNLSAFTGINLKTIIDDFKSQLDSQSLELQRQTQQLFVTFLQQYLNGPYRNDVIKILNGEEVQKDFMDEIVTEFINMLNSVNTGTLRIEVQKGRFTHSVKGNKKTLSLIANRGTDAFKNYVRKAYEEATKGTINYTNSKQGFQHSINITTNTTSLSNGFSLSFGVKFAKIIQSSGTKMLTKTEIEKKIQQGEMTKRDISNKNREIIDLICKELQVDNIYKLYVKNKIEKMLNSDPYMFFVGNSFTNLEGILGEVNAAIAITDLLGPRYTDKALHWIGSQAGVKSGKQPSIDIVVDNLLGKEKTQFGFQVKNTIEEITDVAHYINFSDKNLSYILKQAGIDSDDIESVYFSDTFNVPYKKRGDKYYVRVGKDSKFEDPEEQASFNKYIEIDALIDSIVDSINIYLARHAAEFTYMQYTPDTYSFKEALAKLDSELIDENSTTGNFCYIVGPKVFFANRMLAKLVVQLDALKSLNLKSQKADLQFKTYFSKEGEKGGENFNIVDAMNNNSHLSEHTLKLKTSWGFHT